jgi:two-component system cell cycle sensor histidine kinase/response regulator CckA
MSVFYRGSSKGTMAETPPGGKSPAERSSAEFTFNRIKSVMVVDDDPLYVSRVTRILKSRSLLVKSATNCLDALYIASHDVPDLFLINLVMTAIPGDRFCTILCSQPQLARSYRVVLSSVTAAAELDVEAIGAHACVAKEPWNSFSDRLFKVMRQLDDAPEQSFIKKFEQLGDERKVFSGKLQQARKMEAIGALAGGIAHDFNNILQAMLGYAQLSLFEANIPPIVRQNLEEIQMAAQRATSLIRRLLVFSRKVDSQHRPIDLNEQINHAYKMLKRTIPRMVKIELNLCDELKMIMADGNLLELILINLGVNARDAMPNGGRLLFETKNVFLEEAYCLSHPGACPGQHVLLTVTDSGAGMTATVRRQIFDPFFTTKESGQGTGLGLAMVYGIVKDHGGFISCESQPGKGSSFQLFFPSIDTGPSDASAVPLDSSTLPGGNETLLIVDDEEGIRDFGRRVLQRYGYTVLVAQSAEEALGIYHAQRDEIAAVIVDLLMPGMGGLKCIEHLLEINPACRIISSSGYAVKEQIESTLNAGALDFVAKPYLVSELLVKIRSVLERTPI